MPYARRRYGTARKRPRYTRMSRLRPYRRSYRSSRRVSRRRWNYRNRITTSASLLNESQFLITSFKYVSFHQLTYTSPTVATQQFRLNSIYRPDFTGAGSTPAYPYNLYATLGYNSYEVLAVTWVIKIQHPESYPGIVMAKICNDDQTSTTAGSDDWQYYKNTSRYQCKQLQNTANRHTTILLKAKFTDVYPKSQDYYNYSVFNTNPALVVWGQLRYGGLPVSQNSTINFSSKICMKVRLSHVGNIAN